jgi:UDP-N-acetylmuramoylalanine--D-glutamate ligase
MTAHYNPVAVKTALVIGLGSSGEAAARLLMRQGAAVTLVDAGSTADVERRAESLRNEGVVVHTAAKALPDGRFELCVLSPGVPSNSPWVQECRQRGIPVLSELELGWRHLPGRVLAVTGSNGKSTLVKLCRDALRCAGLTSEAGANFGTPLSALALVNPAPDWIVAEVSSFQLETVDCFSPDVAILLNINPNHLDRHGTMDEYRAMKLRLFHRMGDGQTAVLPLAELSAASCVMPASCIQRTFGLGPEAECRYAGGMIEGVGLDLPVDVRGTAFDNEVMGMTAAACVAAMIECGANPQCVGRAAREFERLPHRMQTVGVVRDVVFVNDSKATNLAAMAAALQMGVGPVRLIAGGLLKEKDLDGIKKILVNRVSGVYLIGKYSREMALAWEDTVQCTVCNGLRDAVSHAWEDAKEGDTILLSPGCASFDQFKGFEDRGEQFIELVLQIKKGELK